MEITKVRIQNFKSIVDSGEVEIEPKLTVLIGKNEQGKSNFLKALKSFNKDYKYNPNDLPKHLHPSLVMEPKEEVPIVTLWLKFNTEKSNLLGEIIGNTGTVKYLKVLKHYGNNYSFSVIDNKDNDIALEFNVPNITKQIEKLKNITIELKTKLEAHTQRLQDFGNNRAQFEQLINDFLSANFSNISQIDNLLKTLFAGIKGLPAQDQPIQNDVTLTIKNLEAVSLEIKQISSEDRAIKLLKMLPSFIFHDSILTKIPNEVEVEKFINEPEITSAGMLNLCTAAGLSIQKIQELVQSEDVSQREAYEDYHKGLISGSINKFWTQKQYEIHFRIEKDKLSLSISDGTYTPRIPPSDRSDGFQWLLSFYSIIQNECALSSAIVVLLDNPALELHVDGQRDIKNFLENQTSPNIQIIYVTHSPAMVDPLKLEQIRKVELLSSEQGTKISKKLINKEGDNIDILEPLRCAIGSSIGFSLIANNYNILVEGSADKFILEGILLKFCTEIKNSFVVNGSLAESKECLLARIYKGFNLPFVAILDSDSGGREIIRRLKNYDISEKNIIELGKIFSEKEGDFALADLIAPDDYYKAVKIAYPKLTIEKPVEKGSKIEKTYEDAFKEKYKIGFSKTLVAQALKKMLIVGKRSYKIVETEQLNKLANEIYARLTNIL